MASGETKGSAIGRRVILPADFIGGPRNMRRKYVDAMSLVQKFGKPDIFLNLTCNPNWPEFKDHLFCHEEIQNRADLVVRVFHAKLQLFKDEILKKKHFWRCCRIHIRYRIPKERATTCTLFTYTKTFF